jgi:hypothetical protein
MGVTDLEPEATITEDGPLLDGPLLDGALLDGAPATGQHRGVAWGRAGRQDHDPAEDGPR